MQCYVVAWEIKDVETTGDERRCEIFAYGKNDAGDDVCLRMPWTPFFYVEVPHRSQTDMGARAFALTLYEQTRGLVREKCRIVKKKPFVGFRNGKKLYYVQVVFDTLASWRRAKYNTKHTLYESAMDPLNKYFHVSGVNATGWMTVGSAAEMDDEDGQKHTKRGVREFRLASYRELRVCEERANDSPPLVICSWDIEAYSGSGNFPDSSKPSDKVITIGAVYTKMGETEPTRRSVHVLGTCHDIPGVDVTTYDDERDLIEGFMRETVSQRTDFLLGWNTYGFDHSYLDGRAACLIDYETGKSSIDMTLWGKTNDPEAGRLVEKKLASSAYGDNTYHYHHTPGMISVDALQIFRKETKHDSYTLDNISKHYLDVSKIDLKPWEMFEKFREEDPQGRTDIAAYCVRDCELPIKLVHKMNMLNGLIEFSKVTSIPIEWLLLRGQQIRVYSLIAKAARAKDFLIPDMHGSGDDTGGFTGAVVLDPLTGGYTEDVVSVMDFASLYPSIIMAHRMCGSTLVTDQQYAFVPGIDYYEVEASPGMKVRFAQTEDNVIPGLLYELKALRKQAKRDMALAEDDFTRGLMNSRQLAYKLVMNSLYGALGSNHGLLCGLKKISMSVTATGRWMINETKRLVETLNPGSKVVYGDSVAEWTPITIRFHGQIDIVTFKDLASRVTWHPRGDGKDVAHRDGLEIWSDQGWTAVQAIVRHTHTNPLVRVATHTGVVDVTAHHSLLRPNGDVVKPREVSIGDDLMHAEGPSFVTIHVATERSMKFSRICGFFIGDGSCGQYRCPSGAKTSWALNNSDLDLLHFYKGLLEDCYPEYGWKIIDTLKSSGVYKLIPNNKVYGSIVALVKEWGQMCYSCGSKVIPRWIHESEWCVKREFMRGFYDADGIKSDAMRFDQKNQLTCAHFYSMLRSMGYRVSISTRVDKHYIFRLTGTMSNQRKAKTSIKKMYEIPYDGYVYDVTTENHHFSAGVGDMVVHNTDSVLCILNCGQENRQNLREHFRVAEDLADQITKHFLPPHELEMEKAYYPYLLVTKKRYAGLCYEHPDKTPKIDIKGLQLVRRDSPKIVKRISHGMLEKLLYDRSFQLALEYVQREILRMLNDEVPYEEYVMSKSLRSNYKNTNLPHLVAARKRQQRGSAPYRSGERVPFVYVRDSEMDLGVSQRAEDAEYARDNRVPIDTLYYIRNQVLNPCITLLQLHFTSAEGEILNHRDIASRMVALQATTTSLVKEAKRVRTNTTNKQREITSFFKKDP
ncbi:MAG: DNA polymerase domain-containing protein [Pontimonas sp.]